MSASGGQRSDETGVYVTKWSIALVSLVASWHFMTKSADDKIYAGFFVFFFLEREKTEERRTGTETWMWIDRLPLVGTPAFNLSVCPDRESRQWPPTLQDNAHPTEPHRWLIRELPRDPTQSCICVALEKHIAKSRLSSDSIQCWTLTACFWLWSRWLHVPTTPVRSS